MPRLLTRLLLLALGLSCLACQSTPPSTAPDPGILANTCAADFPRGCVAADHFLASAAGADMLTRGGNAVDAAVATSFTLSVVRPYSCGIGGGGFMVIYLVPDATHPRARAVALNYREITPAGIDPLFYERQADPDASTRGATAVGVPGTVAGLLYALEHYGTLERATVLAPAIATARNGFRVDQDLLDVARDLKDKFDKHPDWKTRFAFVWSRYLKEGKVALGDVISNPEQAAALELIARDGAAAFYQGPIGTAITSAVQGDHGVMTLADLGAYTPVPLQPLSFSFAGDTFLAMPPPSSGGVAMAETLGLLALWGASDSGSAAISPAAQAHRLTEAFKHAFADRAEWLADPAFSPVPIEHLMSQDSLATLARRFDPAHTLDPARYGSRRAPDAAPGAPPNDSGTSHLCATDRFGNAVACTETINLEFGSLLAVPQYGFCLNNQMDDFLTRRGKANEFKLTQSERNLPAPGKRPLSSMSPTIVLSGSPSPWEGAGGKASEPDSREPTVIAVAGASGGPRIITATTQVLLHTLIHGMSAGDAVNAPRIHHQWMPDLLQFEGGYLEQPLGSVLIESMHARGHSIGFIRESACVQLIRRAPDAHSWQAACDPRKGGKPAGH